LYLSRDPLGLVGANWGTTSANRNLYAYVGFAPIERTDYWGLETPGASDEAETFIQFLPVLGPGIGLKNSIENGNWGLATANAAFLVLDVFTLGEAGLVRGAAFGAGRAVLNAEARNIGRAAITEGLTTAEAGGAEIRSSCAPEGASMPATAPVQGAERPVPTIGTDARTVTDPGEVYRRLEKYHGIDPNLASERLHQIKPETGHGASDNVIFDLSGNVYDQSGNWLGSLTEGGSKR